MDIELSYEPICNQNIFGTGSTLRGVFIECFGTFPLVLSSESLDVLNAIQACGNEGVGRLIDAINEYGEVRVKCSMDD